MVKHVGNYFCQCIQIQQKYLLKTQEIARILRDAERRMESTGYALANFPVDP